MADFKLVLTPPQLRGEGTEGGLDTAISSGASLQRTGFFDVFNSGRKVVAVKDGETFDDALQSTLKDIPGAGVTA